MEDSIAAKRKMYLEMPLLEKRALYTCGENFNTLNKIETWASNNNKGLFSKIFNKVDRLDSSKIIMYKEAGFGPFSFNPALCEKVSMWIGDITTLEIDAIVNSVNQLLMCSGGVNFAIRRAAGSELTAELDNYYGCPTGQIVVTGAYKLPAKYIINTAGPIIEKPDLLQKCYQNSLDVLLQKNLRSIAFPCISTGSCHYPPENAARVALTTVRKFLDKHSDSIDRVIFCLFRKSDIEIYSRLMQVAFPMPPSK